MERVADLNVKMTGNFDRLNCISAFSEHVFNLKTNRFLAYYKYGYVDGDDNNDDITQDAWRHLHQDGLGRKKKMPRQKKPRGHVIAKGIVTYDLTKMDVAEALLVAAVRLFFEDAHPVPIYQLASSARRNSHDNRRQDRR